jgi:hypothetical protein
VKPERLSLLPRKGLEAIARVYAFGAQKYAAHNWRRRYEWSKSTDAAMRHIAAFNDGETNDPESGLPHLAHAGFHILALLTWLEDDGEGADNPMDDRWPAALERAAREADPGTESIIQALTGEEIRRVIIHHADVAESGLPFGPQHYFLTAEQAEDVRNYQDLGTGRRNHQEIGIENLRGLGD